MERDRQGRGAARRVEGLWTWMCSPGQRGRSGTAWEVSEAVPMIIVSAAEGKGEGEVGRGREHRRWRARSCGEELGIRGIEVGRGERGDVRHGRRVECRGSIARRTGNVQEGVGNTLAGRVCACTWM